jgi:hypothetical protein
MLLVFCSLQTFDCSAVVLYHSNLFPFDLLNRTKNTQNFSIAVRFSERLQNTTKNKLGFSPIKMPNAAEAGFSFVLLLSRQLKLTASNRQ